MTEFPAPPERDLPQGRHRLLKEHLMREIQQTQPQPQPAPRNRIRRPGPHWLPRPAITAPLAAAVLLAGTVAGVAVMDRDSRGEQPLPAQSPSASPSPSVSQVRDDQFAYRKTKDEDYLNRAQDSPGCTMIQESDLWISELWDSVDGKHDGLLRDSAERADGSYRKQQEWPRKASQPSTFPGTYRDWERLPTDADAMYALFYAQPEDESGVGDENAWAWTAAGDVAKRTAALPPEVGRSLYEATARIPGVTVIDDVVDGQGRNGIALMRATEDGDVQEELIFDKSTEEFLGYRKSFAKDTYGGSSQSCPVQKGFTFQQVMVLEEAIVDKTGQRP